ncbi:MAG: efflux RND transporter periplasmic adaptor subunit, partial [Haloferula sp.]
KMNETELESYETERRGEIRAVMSFVLVLLILAGSVGVAVFLAITKVKAKPDDMEKSLPSVLVTDLEMGRHVPMIYSEGASVEEGQEIAKLNSVNFDAALKRAEASRADAELALALEQAKGAQARKDWQKLGKGEASELVLREPQIESAQARLDSAIEEVARANMDVSRTTIKAPFSGRVREAGVEVGAVTVPGSMVAEIFSDTELEVRLPFSLDDFGLLQADGTPEFTLSAEIGGVEMSWPAELARVEGEVERATLSGHAIATVKPNVDGVYPPVGLFVKTRVEGRPIENVVKIPRAALRGGNVVWVVDGDVLRRKTVRVARSTRDHLIVEGEFNDGERLVLTRLSAPIDGTKVSPMQEETDEEPPKD